MVLFFKLEEEENPTLLLHLPNYLLKQRFLVQRRVQVAGWLWAFHKQFKLWIGKRFF
jgi:hypothetical protein